MLRNEAKAAINEEQLFAMHGRQTQILATAPAERTLGVMTISNIRRAA